MAIKIVKVRYSFGCGFCGAGGRMYVNVADAFRASKNHACRGRSLSISEHSFIEGRKKPIERKYEEAVK